MAGFNRSRAPSLGGINYSRSPSLGGYSFSRSSSLGGSKSRSPSLGGFKFSRSPSLGGSEATSPSSSPLKCKKSPCTDVRRARAIQRWRRIQQQVYSANEAFSSSERRKAFQERRWFTISNPESYPYRFSVCPQEKLSLSVDVATGIAEREGLLSKRERRESMAGRCSSKTSPALGRKARGLSPGRYAQNVGILF